MVAQPNKIVRQLEASICLALERVEWQRRIAEEAFGRATHERETQLLLLLQDTLFELHQVKLVLQDLDASIVAAGGANFSTDVDPGRSEATARRAL